MSIGQAYADILTPREQQALAEACDWLIDHAFDERERIEKPQDVLDSAVGEYLPTRYVYRYTPLFFKMFAVCIITVAWKLAQSEHMLLSCALLRNWRHGQSSKRQKGVWKTERTLLTHVSIGILKIPMWHFSSMIATMVLMRLKSPSCWTFPPSLLPIGFSHFLMRLRGWCIPTYSKSERGMQCHRERTTN